MKNRIKTILGLLLLLVFFPFLTQAQGKNQGEIQGLVVEEGENAPALPGATITLTGENLFQKSLSTISNDKGFFRFVNLNPGSYDLEITLSGFSVSKFSRIPVSAGRSTPIKATLSSEKLQEEVTVVAQAPLIETKTPQVSVSYSAELIENIPTTRDIKDLVNASPGINDNLAYGSRGRVNNSFAEGSMSSTYKLNGVDVSGIDYSYTFVTPIFETIEEFQVAGIGTSAESGNFTGAAINIITKSGNNELHGGASVNFTNDKLMADNTGGLPDLRPGRRPADFEGVFHLGGPIIKEKLFFYTAGSYVYKKYEEEYGSPVLSRWKRPNYYGKLDLLINNKNTVTAMVMGNPLSWYDLYMVPGSPKTIGADEFLDSIAWYGGWQSVLSERTYFDMRYSGYWNKWSRYPHTRNVPRYSDGTTGKQYGGFNYDFDMWTARQAVVANLTHNADHFIGASHELRAGVEYENGHDWKHLTRPGSMSSRLVGDQVLWSESFGGNDFSDKTIKRISGYVQDNLRIGRKVSMNLGVRFDSPKLTAKNVSGTVHSYTAFSPHLGLSYDISGDAKNVLHFSFGKFYDKMMTGGFGLMLPGRTDVLYYREYFENVAFDPTNDNIIARFNELQKPENLYSKYTYATPIPIDPNLKQPYTTEYTAGFEKQLFRDFAFEITYLYRKLHNFVQVGTHTEHVYESFDWTDPFLGRTVTLWQQVDSLPDDLYYTNSSWQKARTHLLMFQLRRRMVGRWSMDASFVYEDTKSNQQDPNVGFLFGQPPFNVDNDPMYSQNPLMWGEPWMSHKYVFKLLGTYLGPWGIIVSGNFRALSGIAWETSISSSYADIYRSYGGVEILLDQRGSNHLSPSYTFDLRFAKTFKMQKNEFELRLDIMNIFNVNYALVVYTNPDAVYSNGHNAYGKSMTSQFQGPRQLRLGLRWRF